MSAKTASKTSKTSKTAHDPDAVSTVLLDRVVSVAGQTEAAEITLLHEFAAAMTSGVLSVRGYKATIEAAKAAGAALAFLRPAHGQHLQLMSDILHMTGAPQRIAEANTAADRIVRVSPSVKGTPKTVAAANALADAVKRGKTYADTRKAVDAKFRKITPKTRAARPAAESAPAADATPATMTDTVNALRVWIAGAADDALTADIQAAFLTLADAIHDRLDALAE